MYTPTIPGKGEGLGSNTTGDGGGAFIGGDGTTVAGGDGCTTTIVGDGTTGTNTPGGDGGTVGTVRIAGAPSPTVPGIPSASVSIGPARRCDGTCIPSYCAISRTVLLMHPNAANMGRYGAFYARTIATYHQPAFVGVLQVATAGSPQHSNPCPRGFGSCAMRGCISNCIMCS